MVLDQIGSTGMGRNITLTEAILKEHTNDSNTEIISKAEEDREDGYYKMAFLQGGGTHKVWESP